MTLRHRCVHLSQCVRPDIAKRVKYLAPDEKKPVETGFFCPFGHKLINSRPHVFHAISAKHSSRIARPRVSSSSSAVSGTSTRNTLP
ncbi:Dipeptidyl aminopeptidase/acylaminoacyl peptidase [Pseudomonas syringae pv. actinidiae]|uniref:Dipeptidyl aminopeptidase/acylaminoacyl peptidase n=1 Tax=Pseudomonas syringae pv. actinidiae TaxID=103796 RepID=A0AAN4TPM3_PSESF|nr:Dipeptidyl aminopeptidase/acylaminoacyl peptidase [Pseudomonas syringae pv. actinidiae]